MFDYLQKFNTLPQNLRDSVSSPAAMAVILELETKYKIDLAATVMKVMVKTIPLAELSIYFVSDFSLDEQTAKKLTADLKERLFFPVANYLGYNASYSSVLPHTASPLTPVTNSPSEIDRVIKAVGISFASLDLNYRFKNILTTYLKGVRSRVDTRLTLGKEIISGGLGLEHKVIDKIFNICDEIRAGKILPSGKDLFLPNAAILSLPKGEETAKTGLDKIRSLYEKPGSARDIPYDLKAAIVKGEIKKPSVPLNLPIPEEAGEKMLSEHKEEIKPVVKEEIKPVLKEDSRPVIAPIIIAPKVESKVTAPIIAAPKVVLPVPEKEIDQKIIIPVSTPIIPAITKISIPQVPPLKPETALSNNSPVVLKDVPKIIKPPEKKASLFSGLFGSKKEKVLSEIMPVRSMEQTSTSVADLRNSASGATKVSAPVLKQEARIAPKVMGPLEELRYLDLVNFRRFGSSPVEIVAKVESKIRLLEKDGYDKMIGGVAAWRDSPVNSMYLKMGQEALKAGITFKELAATSKNSGNNAFLFWEEIEAIMALNGRLMF